MRNITNITMNNPGEFKLIDKNEIIILPPYQRSQKSAKKRITIKKIKREFCWSKFGAVSVSFRNGKYYCMDGAGRVTVAMDLPSITLIPCMVFYGLSIDDEAASFIDVGMNTIALSWCDRYKAGIVAKDSIFLELQTLAGVAEREIIGSSNKNTIACISELHKRLSDPSLRDQLFDLWDFFIQLFEGSSFDTIVIRGICYLDSHIGGLTEFNKLRIIDIGSEQLLRNIRKKVAIVGGGSIPIYASAIAESHNMRLTYRKIDQSLLLGNKLTS